MMMMMMDDDADGCMQTRPGWEGGARRDRPGGRVGVDSQKTSLKMRQVTDSSRDAGYTVILHSVD